MYLAYWRLLITMIRMRLAARMPTDSSRMMEAWTTSTKATGGAEGIAAPRPPLPVPIPGPGAESRPRPRPPTRRALVAGHVLLASGGATSGAVRCSKLRYIMAGAFGAPRPAWPDSRVPP